MSNQASSPRFVKYQLPVIGDGLMYTMVGLAVFFEVLYLVVMIAVWWLSEVRLRMLCVCYVHPLSP